MTNTKIRSSRSKLSDPPPLDPGIADDPTIADYAIVPHDSWAPTPKSVRSMRKVATAGIVLGGVGPLVFSALSTAPVAAVAIVCAGTTVTNWWTYHHLRGPD